MTARCVRAVMAILVILAGVRPLPAAQLHVEPVLFELNAPAAAAVLTVRNDDDRDITVQTRVVRWSQTDGNDILEPATDVVASPPLVTLSPGKDYVVRIVRVTKQPVVGEESYRVIVDQLPGPQQMPGRAVNVLIRQSIPVFFRARDVAPARVSWAVRSDGNRFVVTASNAGGERLRIASLKLRDPTGATISFGGGLAGYVLGRSMRSWIMPKHAAGFGMAGPVSIAAESDKGPINAIAQSTQRP